MQNYKFWTTVLLVHLMYYTAVILQLYVWQNRDNGTSVAK